MGSNRSRPRKFIDVMTLNKKEFSFSSFLQSINWAYNFCISPNPMKIQVMEIIILTCFPSAGGYTLIAIGIKPDL